ncbi:hypothetical protein C8R46DRAFT_1352002 [Mycena filopes]|nr:hypothetical protein C8R46DRAFT_1352002 [Mycena filopes]
MVVGYTAVRTMERSRFDSEQRYSSVWSSLRQLWRRKVGVAEYPVSANVQRLKLSVLPSSPLTPVGPGSPINRLGRRQTDGYAANLPMRLATPVWNGRLVASQVQYILSTRAYVPTQLLGHPTAVIYRQTHTNLLWGPSEEEWDSDSILPLRLFLAALTTGNRSFIIESAVSTQIRRGPTSSVLAATDARSRWLRDPILGRRSWWRFPASTPRDEQKLGRAPNI